ncbi:uncharacterized protein FMAN_14380 [Fusarium mangiferae]|uniref:Uncharacterized protein n=1 Tax=Fusarium mangiferae TaxID=192010 RepID=A0A1L7UE56_FUSMA|nr:uncharacterized protein FMAN_14380 [Fusarium mangiferae]CVL07472.1 uncharacterized protein FMAN_14380 [Fusarium mangiferae]
MYVSKVSAALLCLAVGVSDVAAGPCKPESSQTLTGSSLGATSSVLDVASTSTSIVSSAETTHVRPDNELSSTVSLGSSSVESSRKPPSTSTAPGNEQPKIFTGFATWVDQNGAMGDCGWVSQNTDFAIALDYRKYDRSMCGQKIRVTATSGRRIGLLSTSPLSTLVFPVGNETHWICRRLRSRIFGHWRIRC